MNSTSTSQQGQVPTVPMLTPAQVQDRQDKGTPIQFIDARGEEDWNASPVKLIGAIRYNKGQALPDLPKNEPIVTYCTCPHDEAARYLAQQLLNSGYQNVHALEGGFNLWKEEGFPLEQKPNP